MDGPRAELVVAKRLDGQRLERGPLLGEHRGDLTRGGAVDAGVRPAGVPAVEVGLSRFEGLEAQALERALRVGDRRLDFPLPIGVVHPTGQRDGAVVREEIAVEGVHGGVVDVRRQHALAEIVEDDDAHGASQPAKRLLVQLGPGSGARGEEEQPHALAAVAQREDKQPGATVRTGHGMAHHRPGPVVDLAFFPGGRHNHRVRLGEPLAAERNDEAADARILRPGSRDHRRGRARSPWHRGRGPGPPRSARDTARTRWRGVPAPAGEARSGGWRSLTDKLPGRWTPLWPDLPAGAPTAQGAARRARRP